MGERQLSLSTKDKGVSGMRIIKHIVLSAVTFGVLSGISAWVFLLAVFGVVCPEKAVQTYRDFIDKAVN